MASPSAGAVKPPSPPPPGHTPSKMERRMSHFKEYKFFRSFSAKVENWPMRKAEQLWRKMRERKIADTWINSGVIDRVSRRSVWGDHEDGSSWEL
ncbi:hypothetical protein JYU34_004960, partial [Plutella xylostella]